KCNYCNHNNSCIHPFCSNLAEFIRADYKYHDAERASSCYRCAYDQATVSIENIHQHLEMGKPKSVAIWEACKEIVFPEFLILLCILAVFVPSFVMVGV